MTRVCVNGVTGRMGRQLVETGLARSDVTVVAGIGPDPDGVDGVPTYEPGDIGSALAAEQPDVVVDFSTPAGTRQAAAACRDMGAGLVVGTTDLGADEHAALAEASDEVPVLQATNFARGIQGLLGALDAALASLPAYDVEVLETHHNGKRDAPSGTAETILSTVRDHQTVETVPGREGVQPRADDEVGMLVRRAGDVRGEHEILLAGNDECLTLTHRAEDRGVFASGALDAAAWLDGRDPGEYTFGDVVTEDRR